MYCRSAIILICCCLFSISTCISRYERSGSGNAWTRTRKLGIEMDNMLESHNEGTWNDTSKFRKLLASATFKYRAVKEIVRDAHSAVHIASEAVETVKKFIGLARGVSSIATKFMPWAGMIEATLAGFQDHVMMNEIRDGFKEMKKEFQNLHIKLDDGFRELKNHINLVDYRSTVTTPTAHLWERYQNVLANPSPQTIDKLNKTCGHHSPETTMISLRSQLNNYPQLLMDLVENSKYDGRLFDDMAEVIMRHTMQLEMLSVVCEQLHYNFISQSHMDSVEKNVREIAMAVESAEQHLSEGYWPDMVQDIYANEMGEIDDSDDWDEISSRWDNAKAKLGPFNRARFNSLMGLPKNILFFTIISELSSKIYPHDGFVGRRGKLWYTVFREMSNCTSWSKKLRAEYSCDEPADNCMKTIDDRPLDDYVSNFYYQLHQPTYLIAFKITYIKNHIYGISKNKSPNYVIRAYKIDGIINSRVLFIIAGNNCDENAATTHSNQVGKINTNSWLEPMLSELEAITEQEEEQESFVEQEEEQESVFEQEKKQEKQTSLSTCLAASVYLILLIAALTITL